MVGEKRALMAPYGRPGASWHPTGASARQGGASRPEAASRSEQIGNCSSSRKAGAPQGPRRQPTKARHLCNRRKAGFSSASALTGPGRRASSCRPAGYPRCPTAAAGGSGGCCPRPGPPSPGAAQFRPGRAVRAAGRLPALSHPRTGLL